MRFLLIDTCGKEGSVALADTERQTPILASEDLPGRSSSERLVPAVRQVMEACGWLLRDLTAIVVVSGPGSFTGVRVGLSATKGLSEAAATPVIAVSRLTLLAGLSGQNADRVCAVLDAGRGEFYFGEVAEHRSLREVLMEKAEVEATAAGCVLVTCEANVAEALQELRPELVREPVAADALPMAVERALAAEFDDVAALDANYLRRTDAQIFARPKSAA
ncbi:MAG: tRNA (adenosine(37)-N6)-threonylcarbamoyltransferase complex dimerization subunit type 1 TsaB [Acidobacteriaceae bacterium]|nr:tRNA (adenosine(37)-N6)-threonylcarbamoyltransferase complex dimerization subunit type 1 TsaB [Acidobacteriaceae bacterium]